MEMVSSCPTGDDKCDNNTGSHEFNWTAAGCSSCVDADGDGWSGVPCGQEQLDCDDSTPDVAPGAPERLNGLDDDCDQAVDEALAEAAVGGVLAAGDESDSNIFTASA